MNATNISFPPVGGNRMTQLRTGINTRYVHLTAIIIVHVCLYACTCVWDHGSEKGPSS